MKKTFWNNINRPIIGMSPMDGVTDAACRYIAKKYGKTDITYTEFVSAEGLWRIKKRGEMDHKIWKELRYDESERMVVAQLFGSDPDSFYEAAKIVAELGFDGIDINMGCPSPGLEKREGGAGLMRNKVRAREVIEATRKGVEDWANGRERKEIPVSVKTRIGSKEPDQSWWEFLASMELPAVAMHGRTFKQLYTGEADWEALMKAAEIIRESGALFLANGDVKKIMISEGENLYRFLPSDKALAGMTDGGRVTLNSGEERLLAGLDGVLIGRQSLGNPWVLRKDGYEPTRDERLTVAVEHAKKHEELFPEHFVAVRKHLVSYVKGFADATELRKQMVTAENAADVQKIRDCALEIS